MKRRTGFTLVEILIVVVILGILAAIVIPQFSDASEDAKDSSLRSNLQTIRSQIQLYKIEHNGSLPTGTNTEFVDKMTSRTTVAGVVDANGAYGPYLLSMPKNPFDDIAAVTIATDDPDLQGGWHFNPTTGEFTANDSAAHAEY